MSLTELKLPETLSEIGSYSFGNCQQLPTIDIPDNVRVIGSWAFSSCSNLAVVKLSASLEIVEEGTFAQCSALTDIQIPASVTSIGNYAFSECLSLPEAPIGENVQSIGAQAYSNCTSLTEVSLPNSVTSIGNLAFVSCDNMEKFSVGDGLTELPERMFMNCPKLKDVSLSIGIKEIKDETFSGCRALESIKLPEQLVYIGSHAFQGCALYEINLPSTLSVIGEEAFKGCNNLQNIVIPDGVTMIGKRAFASCISVEKVTLSSGLARIEDGMFQGCEKLFDVTIGGNVETLGSEVFDHCIALGKIILPESVKSIGLRAFNACTGLVEVWSYATTPPVRGGEESMFGNDFNYDVCTLYVPYPTKSLYCEAEDWKNFQKIIEIGKIYVQEIVLDKYELTVASGHVDQITATVIPEDATEKELAWTSSDESVVTVSQSGEVTGVAKGTALIKVSATDDSGVEAVCAVTVISLVEEIILTPEEKAINEGESFKIETVVLPEDADNKVLEWSSSDDNIALVDQESIVTAISHGEAVITAASTDGSDIYATCRLTVTVDTGIDFTGYEGVSVRVIDGEIRIYGTNADTEVSVYTLGGAIVYNGYDSVIRRLAGGIYFVRINNSIFKVIL